MTRPTASTIEEIKQTVASFKTVQLFAVKPELYDAVISHLSDAINELSNEAFNSVSYLDAVRRASESLLLLPRVKPKGGAGFPEYWINY